MDFILLKKIKLHVYHAQIMLFAQKGIRLYRIRDIGEQILTPQKYSYVRTKMLVTQHTNQVVLQGMEAIFVNHVPSMKKNGIP